MRGHIDRYFGITSSGGSVKTEILAGVTTFMTMSYIIFVNPRIIAPSGMPESAVITATCLAAAIATLIMGIYANYPVGLAPSMGINAFFTFGLVLGMGFTWRQAMAAIFIEGIAFIILTLTKVRDKILDVVPFSLKIAIPAGIGFFLVFIGLQNMGLVVKNDSTLVAGGNFSDIKTVLSTGGLLLIMVLRVFNVRGAILAGIFSVTAAGILSGVTPLPSGVVSYPPSLAPVFMQMDFSRLFDTGFLIIVLILLFMDIFNTLGTLIGVAERAGLTDERGRLPRSNRAFMSDAVGTAAGAALGATTVTAYVESVTGVEAGGKTGLTAVTVGILFLLAMFFSPIVSAVPSYATAPALVFVGIVMCSVVKLLNTEDWTEFAPAVITMIVMPLTYNIATGIEWGIVSYAVLKVFSGRFREVSPFLLALTALFILKEVYEAF